MAKKSNIGTLRSGFTPDLNKEVGDWGETLQAKRGWVPGIRKITSVPWGSCRPVTGGSGPLWKRSELGRRERGDGKRTRKKTIAEKSRVRENGPGGTATFSQ